MASGGRLLLFGHRGGCRVGRFVGKGRRWRAPRSIGVRRWWDLL